MGFPTHLNCPYCPAQAFRNKEPMHLLQEAAPVSSKHLTLQFYMCPAKHEVCIAEVHDNSSQSQSQEP